MRINYYGEITSFMFKTEFGSRRDVYIELWIFRGNTKQGRIQKIQKEGAKEIVTERVYVTPPTPLRNRIKNFVLKRLVNIFENTAKRGSKDHLTPKSASAKLHYRLVFFVLAPLDGFLSTE